MQSVGRDVDDDEEYGDGDYLSSSPALSYSSATSTLHD